jgi:hypothetical protein
VPDLTDHSAHGTGPEEALREVEVAMAAWLQAHAANGRPASAQRYRAGIDAVAVQCDAGGLDIAGAHQRRGEALKLVLAA